MHVLQILDVSINVRFDLASGEKKMLQMINACVSHEMRNPINSIFSMNLKLIDIAQQLKEITKKAGSERRTEQINELVEEMLNFAKVQKSSTSLLNFYVHDLLSISQINNSKFRKDFSLFNVEEAVKEVMLIQKDKADY